MTDATTWGWDTYALAARTDGEIVLHASQNASETVLITTADGTDGTSAGILARIAHQALESP